MESIQTRPGTIETTKDMQTRLHPKLILQLVEKGLQAVLDLMEQEHIRKKMHLEGIKSLDILIKGKYNILL